MGDGWETARRLDRPSILRVKAGSGGGGGDSTVLDVAGYEWCAFKVSILYLVYYCACHRNNGGLNEIVPTY